MPRPFSRSSRSRQHGRVRSSRRHGCDSFPSDECSSSAAETNDDDSVLVRPQGCRPFDSDNNPNGQPRGGRRGFLETFSCLCMGTTFDASDYIDEHEQYLGRTSSSPKSSKAIPSSSAAKAKKSKLIRPIAYIADQYTGEMLERPFRQRRSSSFPTARMIFRPVLSDEDTTVTGFSSHLARGWEL